MTATASAVRGLGFEAANVLDGNYDTYWTMADGQTSGTITVDLGKDVEMDVIRIREYIPLGQRVSGWKQKWKCTAAGENLEQDKQLVISV